MSLRESLVEVINCKSTHTSAATSVRRGQTTFAECRSLLDDGMLSNKANRDEDLDSHDKYENKLNHLVRFLMGISEKGELMVSIIKDNTSSVGYIRDNGTMFSLLFGEYFDHEEITGDEWVEMCEDIITEYDITSEADKYITNLITQFFEGKTDQERLQKYSLKKVIMSGIELKTFFDNKEMSYVVSLHTTKQFGKDMINCNRQPNPWLAYNYYMTPLKQDSRYYEHFCGDRLLEYFTKKSGTDTFPHRGMMSGYSKFAEKHKVGKMIPVLQAYIGSHFCTTFEEFKLFNDMVVDFENGRGGGKVLNYWSEQFDKMLDVPYNQLINFYEKEYRPAFEMKEEWDSITNEITHLRKLHFEKSKITAWEDLHVRKYHTGILMITFAIYFGRTYTKVKISDSVNKVIEAYIRVLNSDITLSDNTSVKFYEYFGKNAAQYASASATQRWDHLFGTIFNATRSFYKSRKDDRNKQREFRDNVLTRCKSFLEREKFVTHMTFCPLSSDSIRSINFATGEGLQWLHKTPHSIGGNADDGFLGMTDDNLDGNQKFKVWNCTPNEYWEMIIEHNEALLDELDKTNRKLVQRSIDTMLILISNTPMNA